jgi:putative thymidine phosphorylase
MELKVKVLNWSAGLPVAMLHKDTSREIGVHEGDRISIKTSSKNSSDFSTIVDIVSKLVNKGELGISTEIVGNMGLKDGQKIDVNLSKSPISLSYIRKKLDGKRLNQREIDEIVRDIGDNSLSEPEIALFISAIYENKMNFNETLYTIKSFLRFSNSLPLKGKFIVDKHCIGGIPGNRTTPIVVSICAAAGLTVPKSSSKAITSAAGTSDVIEAIARVEFSLKEILNILKHTNACMVWGGSLGLIPADSKILKVEKMLKVDPRSQLLVSIMSKKIASGSKYVLIDIPYGKTAKVRKLEALKLKRAFEKIGKHFKIKIKVVLTEGNEPIGNGVGPILELIDIIKILNPSENGPEDLKKKSLFLAGELLEMTGKARPNKGFEEAEKILNSGKAFNKFIQIIKFQGGNLKNIKLARFKKDIISNKNCEIKEIDNIKINLLARIAGCPLDKSSGLYIYSHVGAHIKKGDKIMTIYSESKPRLKEALIYYQKQKPIILK